MSSGPNSPSLVGSPRARSSARADGHDPRHRRGIGGRTLRRAAGAVEASSTAEAAEAAEARRRRSDVGRGPGGFGGSCRRRGGMAGSSVKSSAPVSAPRPGRRTKWPSKRRVGDGGIGTVVDAAALGAGQGEAGNQRRHRVRAGGPGASRSAGSRTTPASTPDLLAQLGRRDPLRGRGHAARAWPAGAGSSSAASAARRPKTRHSSSELEASRFAPWTPVAALSPAAYNPGMSVRPTRSVTTPPIV